VQPDILKAEKAFEDALVSRDVEALDGVLAPDFVLIDLRGTVVSKAALLELVCSTALIFRSIVPFDLVVRVWEPAAAVVTGRTEMKVTAAGVEYVFHSRFTHVFVRQEGMWRMASAQGTPIAA